jgi:triacylglycerol esterase/lipase EstA (alpha/beta hydrolase family)
MGQLIAVSGTVLEKRFGDIVFVHGLDGNARSTWEIKNLVGSFWPEWLGADLENVGMWSLDYDATSLAWKGSAMPLIDRATNVLDLCSVYGVGSRPMLFIAHSMGGLLVKQMLRIAKEYNNPVWTTFGYIPPAGAEGKLLSTPRRKNHGRGLT